MSNWCLILRRFPLFCFGLGLVIPMSTNCKVNQPVHQVLAITTGSQLYTLLLFQGSCKHLSSLASKR